MLFSASRCVTLALLGILLMPSPRILKHHSRTHKRHATCEHHLRDHHNSPEERARVLRRAARRMQRLQERTQLQQERARLEQERARAEQARAALQSLDESELQTVQAAADPPDDDSILKKKRRKGKMKSRFWALQETPKIRPTGDFLAMLRRPIVAADSRLCRQAEPLSHYGSGPCHSIPRPREGTTLPNPPVAVMPA
jgi:hypothetical protein